MDENALFDMSSADAGAGLPDYFGQGRMSMLGRPSPWWSSVDGANPWLSDSRVTTDSDAWRGGLLFAPQPTQSAEEMPSLLGSALGRDLAGGSDAAGVEAQVDNGKGADAAIAAPAGPPAVTFNELGFAINDAERARLRREQAMLSRGMAPMTNERRLQSLRGALRAVVDIPTGLIPLAVQLGYWGISPLRDKISGDAWRDAQRYGSKAEEIIESANSLIGLGTSDNPDFQEGHLVTSLLTLPARGIAGTIQKGVQFAARHPNITAAGVGAAAMLAAGEAEAGFSNDRGREAEEALDAAVIKRGGHIMGRTIHFHVVDDDGNPVFHNGKPLKGVMDRIYYLSGVFTTEVKDGSDARLSINQKTYDNAVRKGNIVFEGPRAVEAGLAGVHLRKEYPDFQHMPTIGPHGANRYLRQIFRMRFPRR